MDKRTIGLIALMAVLGSHVQAQPPSAAGQVPLTVAADEDKKTLVEQIIPQAIRDISNVAGSVVGIFNNFKNAIDLLSTIGEALGILQPSAEPGIDALFDKLNTRLDDIAGSLDWKISSTARAERYGKVMSAFYGAMHAMQAGGASSAVLANADSNSSAALFELEDPEHTAFMRYFNASATPGDWSLIIDQRPEVSADGQVYDWRKAIPEFLHYLGVRLQVMTALDPDWKVNGEFRNELLAHRDFLLDQYSRIDAGVVCASKFIGSCPVEDPFCSDLTTADMCADIYTGISQSTIWNGPVGPDAVRFTRTNVINRLPLFDMLAVADQLDIYANPEKSDPDHARIVIETNPSVGVGSPLGCLDTEGGVGDDGTAIVVRPCDWSYPASQDWRYDRQHRVIYNPSFDRCLDVRAGEVADNVQVQVWSCYGVDAQHWWFDSNTRQIVSALGTYLGTSPVDTASNVVAGRTATLASLME